MPDQPPKTVDSSRIKPTWPMVTVIIIAALLCVYARSAFAFLTVLPEIFQAVRIIVPAACLGYLLIPIPVSWRLPLPWFLIVGGALGIGLTSILVLVLGQMGVMGRNVFIIFQLVVMAAGFINLVPHIQFALATNQIVQSELVKLPEDLFRQSPVYELQKWRRLFWVLVPFLALALLASSSAPGFIWSEEGFGYDVLEYHLQAPKEYLEAGRIEYLPHNVYANFPANVEMLYQLNMITTGETIESGVGANMLHLFLAALCVAATYVVGSEFGPRVGVLSAAAMGTCGWLVYLSGLAYVEHGMLFYGIVSLGMLIRSARVGLTEEQEDTGKKKRKKRKKSKTSDEDQENLGVNLSNKALWFVLAGLMAGFACGCKYTAVPMIAAPLAFAVFLMPRQALAHRVKAASLFCLGAFLAFSPWLIKNTVATGNPVFPLASSLIESSPDGWGPQQAKMWRDGHAAPDLANSTVATLKTIWSQIPGDKYQRFGPAILLLGAVGLAIRKIDRIDTILLAILGVQLAVWLCFTHHYSRFAVVILIPLSLLAGRAVLAGRFPKANSLIVTGFVLTACWNLYHTAKLHLNEWDSGTDASLIYDGDLPGTEHYRDVNLNLPDDSRVLLVGDAKAFYFKKPIDYCVVFNENPFAKAAASAASAEELIGWLRDNGYSHVLVNWMEVHRLSTTYGFAPEITPALFADLESAGLKRTASYTFGRNDRVYAILYELPPLPQ